MRLTFTPSWTARVLLLLAVAVVAQVGISHLVALQAADYTGTGWLNAAHTRQVPDLLATELLRVRGVAEDLAAQPGFAKTVRSERAPALQATLDRALSPHGVWWLVAADGSRVIATNAPECGAPATSAAVLPDGAPQVSVCGDEPFAFGWVAIPDPPYVLVYGARLGESFVARVRRVTGAEALLRVRGDARRGSFVAEDGRPIDLRQVELPPSAGEPLFFDEVEIALPGYVGYLDPMSGTLYNRHAARTSWYFGRQSLDGNRDVELELFAPTGVLREGPVYTLLALTIGSVLILVLVGGLVHSIIARYRGPLLALCQSAGHVAKGEFSHAVPVPPRHEMAEFCATYNAMLARLGELVETRSQLAHAAGMAEIAVGVLHNVGNSMTTVGAGVQLARAELTSVPLDRLDRLADLLEENAENLPAFFASGAKGAAMPRFLRSTVTSLRADLDAIGEELEVVAVATEHTMQIVRAQQRYARVASLTSECTIAEVVDDAIRIANVERGKRKIRVIRQYEGVVAEVDRHRLVQIVVNLLANAADALTDAGKTDGCIWVAIAADGGSYRVRVADNGPGIAPEAVTEVFRAGYTTKPGGHGFGLHSSFNAAIEMGGRLSVEPPANGPGVAFDLLLPRHPPKAEAAAV